MLLECATQTDADNLLMPATAATPAGAPRLAAASALRGTYFDDNTVNDKMNMLTLQQGLTFAVDNALDYMPANQAWAQKDAVTAITTVEADARQDNTIYDLMGRKVANPTHGIYIQNGKKVVR